MFVKEVMHKNPEALDSKVTLKRAAEEMQKYDFGFLPVTCDGELVGVATDRDIVIRAISRGLNPAEATLDQAMTYDFFFCHEDDDIFNAAKLMEEKQINRLAVFDKEEHLTGVISIGDIAKRCHDTNLCGELCEAIHK